uniref:Uncharacterized protein n=1 Tax=Anguilla anguilla TaxID=7936 RepID=A0A0E9XL90_ANGAN
MAASGTCIDGVTSDGRNRMGAEVYRDILSTNSLKNGTKLIGWNLTI